MSLSLVSLSVLTVSVSSSLGPFPCVSVPGALLTSLFPSLTPPPQGSSQRPLGRSGRGVRFQTPTSSLGDLDQALPFSELFPPLWGARLSHPGQGPPSAGARARSLCLPCPRLCLLHVPAQFGV